MNPPENPKQDQARAALKSYNAPLLQNPPDPPAPSLEEGLKRITGAEAQWPDMARYASTARIEKMRHDRGWCWCVTVTVTAHDAPKGAER